MGEEGKETHFPFSLEKSDSNWRGKKGRNKRSNVIFLYLDRFQRHKKDKLITTQQRIYPINKDHASTASSYSLVLHHSIISPSLLLPFILHLVQVLVLILNCLFDGFILIATFWCVFSPSLSTHFPKNFPQLSLLSSVLQQAQLVF